MLGVVTTRRLPARLDSLTGLRFFAAFLVFGFHFMVLTPGDRTNALHVFAGGMTGVSFFFIVSGFVLSWSYRNGDTARAFYRRRFARIYPAYAVACLCAICVGVVITGGSSLRVLIPFTLLQAWFPSAAIYYAASAVFWSLSCEAFFYLVFPWVVPRLRMLSRGRLALVAIGSVAFSLALGCIFMGHGSTDPSFWFLFIFPPVQLAQFLLGLALGLLMKGGMRVRVPLSVAVALAMVAVVAAGMVPSSMSRVAVTIVPYGVLVWSAASVDIAGRWSPLRSRLAVTMGVWSYCFYLVHALVVTMALVFVSAFGLGGIALHGLGICVTFFATLALAVVGSGILHLAVEKPMEKRLRGTSRPRLDAGVRRITPYK